MDHISIEEKYHKKSNLKSNVLRKLSKFSETQGTDDQKDMQKQKVPTPHLIQSSESMVEETNRNKEPISLEADSKPNSKENLKNSNSTLKEEGNIDLAQSLAKSSQYFYTQTTGYFQILSSFQLK